RIECSTASSANGLGPLQQLYSVARENDFFSHGRVVETIDRTRRSELGELSFQTRDFGMTCAQDAISQSGSRRLATDPKIKSRRHMILLVADHFKIEHRILPK